MPDQTAPDPAPGPDEPDEPPYDYDDVDLPADQLTQPDHEADAAALDALELDDMTDEPVPLPATDDDADDASSSEEV